MNGQKWDFTLLDTGFFRTGQPFHAGEGGYSKIVSHFPPPVTALQGAIRTTLAAARGWQPGQSKNWPIELGDHNSLGRLSLQGPYLVHDQTILFPAPLTFLIKEKPGTNGENEFEIEAAFLKPGEHYRCDLGGLEQAICLPQKKENLKGAHLPKNLYLTHLGYNAVASGKKIPNTELYPQKQLWCDEPRIGLKLNPETGTAEEQNLYRINHIRPHRNLRIFVIVSGLPDDWPEIKQQIVPLGGEGRLAAVEITPVTADRFRKFLPDCPHFTPTSDGKIHYTLSLITPASTDRNKLEELILKGPANAPGICVSACIGKTQLYGGWDMVKRKPRPLHPYLPPGSTWFFEASASEKSNIEILHGNFIEDEKAPEYGYGQVLLGTWEVD